MDNLFQRIQSSFEKQGFMNTLDAQLQSVSPGTVVISCSYHPGLTQQHGFFHAGVLTSIVDTACGYAALTMMPEEKEVLSVEFKINMMRPAQSSQIIATGKVLKSGKTLTICEGIVTDETGEQVFAKMMATMIGR